MSKMEMLSPLWSQVKNLLLPLAIAVMLAVYGWVAPNPPFLIAGSWAIVVTIALAVLRSLRPEEDD